MKKIILVIMVAALGVIPLVILNRKEAPRKRAEFCRLDLKQAQDQVLEYLRVRKDKLAEIEMNKILAIAPDDICALWAKAEIFRRSYQFEPAEKILKQILAVNPDDAPSLISLSYIRYHARKFSEALKILKGVLRQKDLEPQDKAMAYMLIGSINAKKSSLGGLFSKLAYGTQIKGYFEKARDLAPDLPEVHLGLGTFCMLAPKIAGGNLERAIEELKCAVDLAPEFATANARLAQAYRLKGISDKYNFYLRRAKELDPDNEVVREIEAS